MLRAFAVYMAIALILAATIIIYFMRHSVESSEKKHVADRASFVARSLVPRIVDESAWNKPLSNRQLAEIDTIVNRDLLADGGVALRLHSANGNLLYNSAPADGADSTVTGTHLRQLLDGRRETEVVRLDSGGRSEQAILSWAPVRYAGSGTPVGVLEFYGEYGGATAAVREQALPLAGLIILVFVLLYAALLPILKRMTRQLERSNSELRRRANDLNENLLRRAEIEQRLRETIAKLERSETALALSQEETIMRLSIAVETRDQETGEHIARMGRYCSLLARKIGWSDEQCELLRIAAPLHDVGKIAIPDSVLLKPGALTEDERSQMQRHAEIGHEILAGSDSPLLDLAARIALSHHEHWDGSGYPQGLAGPDIPLEGRMAAVADVFDALTSDRVYRDAMSVEKALAIMAEGRGSHFDPELLDVFFDSIVEVLMIRDDENGESRPKPPPTLGVTQDVTPLPGEQDGAFSSRPLVG